MTHPDSEAEFDRETDGDPEGGGAVVVPHEQLSEDALRGLVLEFVTRDGTDHTDIEPRVDRVIAALHRGDVVLTFDAENRTTHVVKSEDLS